MRLFSILAAGCALAAAMPAAADHHMNMAAMEQALAADNGPQTARGTNGATQPKPSHSSRSSRA